MRRYAALLVALLTGCAAAEPYTRSPVPCQERAVKVVWNDTYGRTDRPPDVWWIPRSRQTCGWEVNGARGVMTPSGCMGAYTAGDNVNLVWYGSWTLTLLAHELAHIAQQRDGLPPDMDHTTAPFLKGGLVEQANQRLAQMSCGLGMVRWMP